MESELQSASFLLFLADFCPPAPLIPALVHRQLTFYCPAASDALGRSKTKKAITGRCDIAKTQNKRSERPVRRSRIAQALNVLQGQQLHPLEMQAQFLEMQVSYESMLNKLSMALTRLAKREQRDVERALDSIATEQVNGGPSAEAGQAAPYSSDKAALRRQVFGGRLFIGQGKEGE